VRINGIKQLYFDNGVSGKALAVLSKEGFCPVYAESDERGIKRLVIEFRTDEE
jgi:hypothetical protein